jgi:hypothetical protein
VEIVKAADMELPGKVSDQTEYDLNFVVWWNGSNMDGVLLTYQ